MQSLISIPKVARMVSIKQFFLLGEIQMRKASVDMHNLSLSPENYNFNDSKRMSASPNANVSYYNIIEDAYEPNRNQRQSYCNGPESAKGSFVATSLEA